MPERSILGVELEHRHQLDGGDPQAVEGKESFRSSPAYVPAFLSETPGAGMAGETSHVHLVDDGA
jgi:hypothetical protein